MCVHTSYCGCWADRVLAKSVCARASDKAVFSFVFGDGDPNKQLRDETRWQLIGEAAAKRASERASKQASKRVRQTIIRARNTCNRAIEQSSTPRGDRSGLCGKLISVISYTAAAQVVWPLESLGWYVQYELEASGSHVFVQMGLVSSGMSVVCLAEWGATMGLRPGSRRLRGVQFGPISSVPEQTINNIIKHTNDKQHI